MPTIPNVSALTGSSVDILNAIRNSASANYRDYVPAADPSQDSVREIGAIIMNYPVLQNEFLTALVNRIGRVLITSKMYSNPWASFKQGMLEFGETVEEIFVNIAKPFQYDPAVAENKADEKLSLPEANDLAKASEKASEKRVDGNDRGVEQRNEIVQTICGDVSGGRKNVRKEAHRQIP